MCYIYILSTIYPLHPSTLYSLLSIPYCLLSALYSQLPTFLLSTLSTYTVHIYYTFVYIYSEPYPIPTPSTSYFRCPASHVIRT